VRVGPDTADAAASFEVIFPTSDPPVQPRPGLPGGLVFRN